MRGWKGGMRKGFEGSEVDFEVVSGWKRVTYYQ